MSKATEGLRTALARGASGTVLAIAEMQTDDIFAGMTDEQKVELSAKFAAEKAPEAAVAQPSSDPEPDPDDPNEPGEDEPGDPPSAAKKKKAGAKAAEADASDGERARIKAVAKAVAEDDSCKGKADLALSMLADDDYAGLNASAMVKLIGKQAAGAEADPESAAREEMRAAIGKTGNSKADASGASPRGQAEESAGIWDRAIAKIFPERTH